MAEFLGLGPEEGKTLAVVLGIIVCLLLTWGSYLWIRRFLRAWAKRTATPVDDKMVIIIEHSLLPIMVLGAVYLIPNGTIKRFETKRRRLIDIKSRHVPYSQAMRAHDGLCCNAGALAMQPLWQTQSQLTGALTSPSSFPLTLQGFPLVAIVFAELIAFVQKLAR